MPIRRVPQFTAWSYSRLSDYENCPRLAKFKHLDKLKEPEGEALKRGSDIHKEAERYVRGFLPALPPSLARFPEEFADLKARAATVAVEQQLALDVNWKPCDWFGSAAWLRIVIDACHPDAKGNADAYRVIDYKTGKIRPANADQLDLYGLVALAYFPHIRRVDSELWYLDAGEIIDRVLQRDEANPVRQRWVKRAKPLLTDVTFAPTPGDGCRWCFFGQSGRAKGGPALCEF